MGYILWNYIKNEFVVTSLTSVKRLSTLAEVTGWFIAGKLGDGYFPDK